ncbi:related to cytoskeleton assembly control protein SLA1 [Fusarium torulosum]|uniref:Actin cytoskeleton-regulatory complex protein SLA1 n=1 Tax=Fusarium torulosum TaxID=33205 RepID=A0AAE8M5Q0_9HYPO|nr:related to cytoskeleton assembly control protein SLA1 [Fusarium torulosum]
MGFLGVYRALYDYVPQAQGELAINDGDLLYILDKNEDDGWWKAKKKAGAEDEEEPTGLVPGNYVEEAQPVDHARALFDYTRQTDEELSFHEDATLAVYDTSDPDWILTGLDGEYGFVPSNYIELGAPVESAEPPLPSPPPALPSRPRAASIPEPQPEAASPDLPSDTAPPAPNPAAAIAGVMHNRSVSQQSQQPVAPRQPPRASVTFSEPPEVEDEPVRSPTLPARPRVPAPPSPTYDEPPSPVPTRSFQDHRDPERRQDVERTPGGFHMYNINEMISVMGKKKKMPTTLGINLMTGIILVAPEHASDGPSQEWTADRMTHYSREGKHVFMELVRPSKSVDFHAGAKDTAEEIVSMLGELAGAIRFEGLRESMMGGSQGGSGSGLKKGQILYDFMAQGEDEVTVAVGDDVFVLDDTKSEEWWQVRRLKNGKEGVVPSSYIEITGSTAPPASGGINSAKSLVEQNRLEEIRLTKEAMKASKEPQQVGPGMPLPERGSSLTARETGSNSGQQQSRRENGRNDGGNQSRSKAKPDASKVRTWTDRSRSFSVEAQFLGLKDGKIHLHKMNGVKIAVPITKMSREDLEYVENFTGISLEDDKPLADVKRARSAEKKSPERSPSAGVTIDKDPKSDYDWFQFFLSCEVAVGLCERYAQAFVKDSMDESVLPDVDAASLRALGIREGDIIKVMRTLDAKYGRSRGGKRGTADGADGEGGLFSGPGGALRNNTRKGRPAPAVQTSDVVDASAFSRGESSRAGDDDVKSPPPTSPSKKSPELRQAASSGFDDDAWDVKPSKQQSSPQPKPQPPAESNQKPAPEPAPVAPPPPALTGSMQELSLLSTPLEPTRTEPAPVPAPAAAQAPILAAQPTSSVPASQPLGGATPSFFTSVAQARQRPNPPQASANQSSLVPPPPQRPLSAPLSAQPSGFAPPPMMPQMTGALQGQVAPPGQSLSDLTQARLQQQYTAQMQQQQPLQQMQPNMTGFPGQQGPGMMSFPTGAGQFMQPMMTGMQGQNQFAPMQAQPTGFQPSYPATQSMYGAPAGSINNYLPPALEPQRTGMPGLQPQMTGMTNMGGMGGIGGVNNAPSPQPLQPQQTGPPPPVRFGVTNETKKLAPQATGRRANLAQATPQNPFGF